MNLLGWLADRIASEKSIITRTWSQLPYLTRWTMLGQRFSGSGYAVFLHRFQRSDADEMHDHPWPFVSIILSGGYYEKTPTMGWNNGIGPIRRRWYNPGRILHRPANNNGEWGWSADCFDQGSAPLRTVRDLRALCVLFEVTRTPASPSPAPSSPGRDPS